MSARLGSDSSPRAQMCSELQMRLLWDNRGQMQCTCAVLLQLIFTDHQATVLSQLSLPDIIITALDSHECISIRDIWATYLLAGGDIIRAAVGCAAACSSGGPIHCSRSCRRNLLLGESLQHGVAVRSKPPALSVTCMFRTVPSGPSESSWTVRLWTTDHIAAATPLALHPDEFSSPSASWASAAPLLPCSLPPPHREIPPWRNVYRNVCTNYLNQNATSSTTNAADCILPSRLSLKPGGRPLSALPLQ
jgi:hypothetical protein